MCLSFSELTREELVNEHLQPFLKGKYEENELGEFSEILSYVSGQYSNIENLIKHLENLEGDAEEVNRIYYLSIPPSVFLDVTHAIGKSGRSKKGWTRVVIEKPFGKDIQTYEKLSKEINSVFKDKEIYRMDHYIGKEVVQNLLVLRFANVIFDPLWDKNNIHSVQILFSEKLGVEGRGGYFDEYGIVRDVVQNHVMQMLTLIAMEPPVSLSPKDIRDEKVKVLRCITPLTSQDCVYGQYIASKSHEGYTDDKTVAKDSQTPTFAAFLMKIRNRRWEGVPFIIKAGKGLNENRIEVRIKFKQVPPNIFGKMQNNELVIRVQPDEAIYLNIMNKVPGLGLFVCSSQLEQKYDIKYRNTPIPDAYVRLILDVIRGNQSNFVSEDEIRYSWMIFDEILKNPPKLEKYEYGSNGPVSAENMAREHGSSWTETSECYDIQMEY
jgi:glucose-6-phosphate 1-dehydrogenase